MTSQDEMVNVFKSLTKVLSDNNKQLHSNDVSDPSKFNGQDSHWDDWYLQWRTFLGAKGWLSTFEHATGPGTVGFDNEINKKIYNKLLSLCQKGTASTYVTKAANFNGWEAAKYLLERYEGFSKQRQRSLRQLVENLRHIHGTNMSKHVDKFERICGQMAHNNPTKPPTEEQKIGWFLGSVTEKTYDSVHSTCTDKLLEGDLTFAKVLKLYTHRCFQRYLHFQVEDIDKATPPPYDAHAKKAQKKKVVLRSDEDAVARETLAHLPPAARLTHATIVPKVKAIPTDNTPKAKAGTTLPPATLALANPNSNPVLTVVAPVTTLATASNALQKAKTTTIKQANQNIIIDEATMEFLYPS
jgi:hypothetical protein